MIKKNPIRVIALLLILSVAISLLISAKSCTGRNSKKTKSGSSNTEWGGIAAPSSLTATAFSYSEIRLSWQDNSNNEDGFEIERSFEGITYTLLTTISTGTASYSDIGLTQSTTYYYRVRALNTIGDRSAWSNEVSTTTPSIPLPQIPTSWSAIAAGGGFFSGYGGGSHSLALAGDGTLWSWGYNSYGQLGLGDTDDRIFPNQIQSDWDYNTFGNIAAVVGNTVIFGYTLAIKSNLPDGQAGGTIWGWGANGVGQLGLGYTESPSAPNQIGNDSDWSILAAGLSHSLGLKTNGMLWAWGFNDKGQLGLGLGDTIDRWTPTLVTTETDWSILAAGQYYSLALKTNPANPSGGGTLWTWGNNSDGTQPTLVTTDTDWSTIAAGTNHSLGLKTNPANPSGGGTLWAWGDNVNGQLGDGTTDNRPTPRQIGTDSDWSIISAGGVYSLALKTTGTLWAWGWNGNGQLGLGDTERRNKPNSIGGIPNPHPALTATLVSLSQMDLTWSDPDSEEYFQILRAVTSTPYSLLTTLSANVISYSDTTITPTTYSYRVEAVNNMGESFSLPVSFEVTDTAVGNSVFVNSFPTPRFDTDWSTIAAGGFHSLALKTNLPDGQAGGTLWAWGWNGTGQLGLGDTIDRNIPCQLGSPTLPSGLIATAISSTAISLTWTDNSSDEDGLKIERSFAGNTNYVQIGTVGPNVTSYSDTTVLSLYTYYYRIKTYNALGESPYSNEVSAAAIIAAPSLLSLSIISSTRFDLSWQDNSQEEMGFKIERKIGSNGTWTEIATVNDNVTDYSDIIETGFAPYSIYYYRVKIWNTSGEAYSNEVHAILVGWSTIAAGENYSLGLRANGMLWAWGYNWYGQLGLGNSGAGTNRTLPTQVTTDTNWSTIAAGQAHSLGLKTTGTLWSWGYNAFGQLGDGTNTTRITPRQIGTDSDWASIATGDLHSIGLKSTGTLWAWGRNSYGQLGDGTNTARTTPRQIGTALDWSQIAGGNSYTIALKTNPAGGGTLWAWGFNGQMWVSGGQLGLGDYDSRTTPTQVGTDSDWSIIDAGKEHSLGLKINGAIWVWGANYNGQLGVGLNYDDILVPTQMSFETDWSILAAGENYSLGLKTNRTFWAWGYNNYGQLGLGEDYTSRNIPMPVIGDTDWSMIAAGYSHTIVCKTDRILWSWGYNAYGQLGLGDTTNRNVPTLIGE